MAELPEAIRTTPRKRYLIQYHQEHKKEQAEHQHRFSQTEAGKACILRGNRKLKEQVLTYYSGGELRCVRCGIADIDVLTIDHINGGGNKHRDGIGAGIVFYRWLRRNGFPDGYQTLCFNCNHKKYLREGK